MRLKIFIRNLLVAALLLFPFAGARAQYDLDRFYIRGRQALVDGKYSLAIENFNILSRLDSTYYEAYFFRGIAKYNLGDFIGAEKDFDLTIHFNPVYTLAYHYRAITLSREGKFEEALLDFQEAVDLRPGYSGLYFSRGVTYFLSQQFDKAIDDFNRYIRREPEAADAYLNRGASYLFSGDTTNALNDYNKAIALNRHDPEGFIRRSRIFALQDRQEDALADLDQAILLDEGNTLAYFNRGLLRYDSRDVRGALSDFEKVLEDEPGNALTLYNRGLILAQMGDFVGALNDFDRVININPENVLALFNRASVFAEMGRYRDAIADYSTAIDLYPDFAKAYMNRSWCRTQIGQFRDAERDWQTARQKVENYMAVTADSAGRAMFADTASRYNNLIALDAEFARKDFDDELLQHRDVDIRLKPLFKFIAEPERHDALLLRSGYENAALESFKASLPVEAQFSARKETYAVTHTGRRPSRMSADDADAAGLFARALLESADRQFNTALVCYDRAIALSPDNLFLYINRGALQADMIDFISSMENNVQVLSLDNTSATRTRVKEGISQRYDYTAAIHDMNRAIDIDPDFPYTYYNRGNLHCLSGELPDAIADYSRALDLYPAIGEAYYNRGLVLIYLKDRERGCIDLSKAGELGIEDAYSVIGKYCDDQ